MMCYLSLISEMSRCSVCGDKATKLRYSHYGAVSCFPCRAFFRRAIEKGQTYSCQREDTCEITIQSRKKCAACRFAKCLKVGMKHLPSVLLGTETDLEQPTPAPSPIPSQEITDEELNKISLLLEVERNTQIPIGEAMFMKTSEESRFSFHFITCFVSAALSGCTLEYAAICWGYTMAVRKLTKFSQEIPEFKVLQSEEQKALLLHNLDPMFNIKAGFFFQVDENTDLMAQMDRFSIFDYNAIESWHEWIPYSQFIAQVVKVPSVKWNQFFTTPWANNLEHERKYEYLVACLENLQLDPQSVTLLSIVALFSTECITSTFTLSSDSITRISQIQSEYCHLLFRYLCYIKGQEEARKLYPQYINMLPNLREMSDIMKNKTIKIVPFPSVEEQLSNISLQ